MSFTSNFQRILYASRFMRVFGKFKRAQLREKPQRKIGPFCNPVKRLVRLKEKERLFCEIGLPRTIPRPKIGIKEKILEAIKPPKVCKEVLDRRLEFLLSNESIYQQMYNKIYNGITPYQCELFMWERQMRDLRKIYRAQYLHKLSDVTHEERNKQLKLLLQTKEDKRKRRENIRNRILEEKKRKAILKDRLNLEKKVTQSILFKRQSEDEEQFEESVQDGHENVSHKQRAHILYSSFTNDEKIKLLDDKIAILTKKIEEKSFSKGIENNNIMFYIQLKDKLEASKQAFLEKIYLKDVNKLD